MNPDSQPPADFPLYPASILLPVFSGIAFILCIAPLAWHVKNKCLAASSLVGWIMLLNLFNVINAIIWPTDDLNNWWNGVGLCDVETKLAIGSFVAVNGSVTAILRKLARIMDTDKAVFLPCKSERRKQLAIELFLCIGFPILEMSLHYIIQSSRYYIFAIAGCIPAVDSSWPTTVILFMWPLILTIIGAYYSMVLIVRMRRYRSEFSRMLEASNTSKSRFIRLFALSLFFVVALVPLSIYVLYFNEAVTHLPYSWDRIHGEDWNYVVKVPTHGVVFYDRYIYLAIGYICFFFFGLGTDAVLMYRTWLICFGCGRFFPSLYRTSPPTSLSSNSIRSSFSRKLKRLLCPKQRSLGRKKSLFSSSLVSDETDLEKGSLSGSTKITTTLTSSISDRKPSSIF